ncbi:hypothetical protein NQZ68_017700 [Dissostichus eleginoides]|nr:hypothetical protein NQZ68_017700 [Dissostichus eleginoides]
MDTNEKTERNWKEKRDWRKERLENPKDKREENGDLRKGQDRLEGLHLSPGID